MEYTQWVTPPVSTNDSGRAFASQLRNNGLEAVLCHIAGKAWASLRQNAKYCYIEDDLAVLDSSEPWYGNGSIFYRLRMPNDSLWVARLHNRLTDKRAAGEESEHIANQALLFESEVATMEFVQQNTNIPVPRVYDYDASCNNALGTRYILMEHMVGKPFPYPFDNERPVKDTDLQKIHKQLTGFVHQLAQHPFNHIGQIHRKHDEDAFEAGPIVDQQGGMYGPFDNSKDFYVLRAWRVLQFEEERAMAHIISGAVANSRIESAELHVKAAEHAGLELFAQGPFILQHAEMECRNVLLDQDCNVVGVTGWKSAQTVPVDSLKILPMNFAGMMLPFQPTSTVRHSLQAFGTFRALSSFPSPDLDEQLANKIVDFQHTLYRDIARCLEDGGSADKRRGHYERLKMMIRDKSGEDHVASLL